jgi:hypothetical protein
MRAAAGDVGSVGKFTLMTSCPFPAHLKTGDSPLFYTRALLDKKNPSSTLEADYPIN